MNLTALESLQSIYETYEQKLAKAIRSASAFAGAFNMGDDPRKDACNEVFYEEAGQWAADFLTEDHDQVETAQAVRWILEYPAKHRQADTYWYAYAAQKHAAGLIPRLSREDASQIRKMFLDSYEKKDMLPVQNEILALLTRQAGQKQEEKGSLLRTWGVRVVLLLVGLTIAHLGVTLFLLADLGSDPFNVMIQGLHRLGIAPVTHGTVHIAVSLLIILVLLVVDRSYVRIGTFLCMILGGPIIDVFTLLLQGVVNSGSAMAVRVIAVVLGCGILAFGMTIVIKSQAGTGPNDLVAVVISDKTRWKFGIVRIAVDMGFALTGFLLGGTVGVGTLICMAVVGPVAQVFMPVSEKICGRFLHT